MVKHSSACPASKPYGVFTQGTDKLHGCFPSADAARAQQKALYANVPEAQRGPAPEPPNYRESDDPNERCGVCTMYDAGLCWGYGNKHVDEDFVCDSFEHEKREAIMPEVEGQYAADVDTESRKEFVERLVKEWQEQHQGEPIEVVQVFDDTAQPDGELSMRKEYSAAARQKMAKEGSALPDGSYPIADGEDLKNAIQAIGRASNKAAAKAHIIKRAKALGLSDQLPEDWRGDDDVWEIIALLAEKVGHKVEDDGSVELHSDDTRATEAEGSSGKQELEKCPTCKGSGKQDGKTCPTCKGKGEVPARGGDVPHGGPTEEQKGDDTPEHETPESEADPEMEIRAHRVAEMEGMWEHRNINLGQLEVRDTSDGGVRFTGYASTTETPYDIADFKETIARGAFKRTLAESPDVRLLVNHGMSGQLPLARTKSGTLSLTEDAHGLRVDADLDPNDPDVRALLPKMQRGDVDEMSFAFRATAQDWNEDYSERLIRECSIHRGDVSIVTMGANSETTATVRSDDGMLELRAHEDRVGKQISGSNEARLKTILNRLAEIDVHADEGQAELSDLLGVPNPDDEGSDNDDDERSDGEEAGTVHAGATTVAAGTVPEKSAQRSAVTSYIETAKAKRAKALGRV